MSAAVWPERTGPEELARPARAQAAPARHRLARGTATPTAVFGAGLRAVTSDPAAWREWLLRYVDDSTAPLDMARWCSALSPGDEQLLEHCVGPTLDVGCGPGRLAAALARRGVPVLGIDITPMAVSMARRAGAPALQRSVFARVPRTGSWRVVLLADGNIGIGGDPAALLSRARELTAPGGLIVCELEPPGTALRQVRVRIERRGGAASEWFNWAHLGVDDVATVAAQVGLAVTEVWQGSGRWFGALVG